MCHWNIVQAVFPMSWDGPGPIEFSHIRTVGQVDIRADSSSPHTRTVHVHLFFHLFSEI
jgi:hypothetical protein